MPPFSSPLPLLSRRHHARHIHPGMAVPRQSVSVDDSAGTARSLLVISATCIDAQVWNGMQCRSIRHSSRRPSSFRPQRLETICTMMKSDVGILQPCSIVLHPAASSVPAKSPLSSNLTLLLLQAVALGYPVLPGGYMGWTGAIWRPEA